MYKLSVSLLFTLVVSAIPDTQNNMCNEYVNWNDYSFWVKTGNLAIHVMEYWNILKSYKTNYDPLIIDPIVLDPFSVRYLGFNYTLSWNISDLSITGLRSLILKPINTSMTSPTMLTFGGYIEGLKVNPSSMGSHII